MKTLRAQLGLAGGLPIIEKESLDQSLSIARRVGVRKFNHFETE